MLSSLLKVWEVYFHGGTFMRGELKICSLVCRWIRGELAWPGDKPAEEIYLGNWGQEETIYGALT